jgi:hypothetical protein
MGGVLDKTVLVYEHDAIKTVAEAFGTLGRDTNVNKAEVKAAVAPTPATLTGYAPTGRETAVETDAPVSGFGAAGANPPRGLQEKGINDNAETITGYGASGAGIPESGPVLEGYEASGAEPAQPGLVHVPFEPKDLEYVLFVTVTGQGFEFTSECVCAGGVPPPPPRGAPGRHCICYLWKV